MLFAHSYNTERRITSQLIAQAAVRLETSSGLSYSIHYHAVQAVSQGTANEPNATSISVQQAWQNSW
jgi:hypothetical protein